ncbi:MAG: hypothetical protein J6Y30_03630 [Treponema sp.]|nr:hypothetical protein [Treponema sp.]
MVRNKGETLEKIGQSFDRYTDWLLDKFAAYALLPENASYIEREASQEEVDKRGRAAGMLFEEVKGLEGIRIVENDSVHIHFSTYDSDIFQQSKDYLAWKDYTALNEIEFANLASSDNGEFASTAEKIIRRASLYFDSDGDRLIFSMPYFDKYTAWRGTIVFYVKAGDFTDELITQDLLPLNTKSKVVAPRNTEANLETPENVGIVFGMPYLAYQDRAFMVDSIEQKWAAAGKVENGNAQRLVIVKGQEEESLMVLVTSSSSKFCKTGWVCNESVFTFSDLERAVILSCLFITLFLIVFTLFNLKHDDMVIISSRIRKFELSLFRQYLERKDTADWRALEKEFSLRRQDVNAEIISSLGKRGKKHRKEVNLFLDQSWSELMSAMSGGRRMAEVISSYKDENLEPKPEKELYSIDYDHSADKIKEAAPEEKPSRADVAPQSEPEDTDEVEELEELDELEEVPEAEAVDDAEEIPEAESVEDVEEIPEAEALEEVEEIPEAEALEGAEEIPEAEAVEELEEVLDVEEFLPDEAGKAAKDVSGQEKKKVQEISAEEAAQAFDDVSPVPEKEDQPMSEQEKEELSSFETVSFDPLKGDEGKSLGQDTKN